MSDEQTAAGLFPDLDDAERKQFETAKFGEQLGAQVEKPLSSVSDRIMFLHKDGSLATGAIASRGEDKDGNLVFWEIQGLIDDGLVDGKAKFKRIQVQRVFPALAIEEGEVQP